MMSFGQQFFDKPKFIAKIKKQNKASINLFENKLGFKFEKEVNAFEEVHYRLEN